MLTLSGIQRQKSTGSVSTHSPSGRSETELIYRLVMSDGLSRGPQTWGLPLGCIFESSVYPGRPCRFWKTCWRFRDEFQGMGLIVILVAGTRLNLSGCLRGSSLSRRFIRRNILRRGTIKNILRSSSNDKKRRYGPDAIFHRLFYPALIR